MWPQQVAIVYVLSVGRWQSATAMALHNVRSGSADISQVLL